MHSDYKMHSHATHSIACNKQTHFWLLKNMALVVTTKGLLSVLKTLNCCHFDVIWWNCCSCIWIRDTKTSTSEAVTRLNPNSAQINYNVHGKLRIIPTLKISFSHPFIHTFHSLRTSHTHGTPYSKTLCSSLSVTDQNSCPYKKNR